MVKKKYKFFNFLLERELKSFKFGWFILPLFILPLFPNVSNLEKVLTAILIELLVIIWLYGRYQNKVKRE